MGMPEAVGLVGIVKIYQVDGFDSGFIQRQVVVGDEGASLREELKMAELSRGVPHKVDDIRRILKRVLLFRNLQEFVAYHIKKNSKPWIV